MGRTVVYDDHVQKLVDELVQRKATDVTVGVIIGQSTQQRDIVVHVASTPKKDDEESQEEGDVKSKAAPGDVEEGWICQHAKQVTRMLPGGIDVLGLFAVGPPDALAAAHIQLRQVLFAIYKSLGKDHKTSFNPEVTDKILLQICSVTRKVTCKTFNISDTKSTAKPADWKQSTGGGSTRWHRLETSLSLNLWVPLSEERCQQGLMRQIQFGLQPFFRALQEAVALLNGESRPPQEALDSGADKRRSRAKDPQSIFLVDLFLPMDCNNNAGQSKVLGPTDCGATMSIVGTIQCRAFVHSKATVQEAIKAIKQDVVRSITSRCEIQCEDMLLIEDEQHGSFIIRADPSLVHELPKRVFFPLEERDLTLCDYIFHGDAAADSLEALHELLGLTVDAEDIELDVEHSPESNQQVIDGVEAAEILTEATEQLSRGRNMLIPIASAAIAALGAGISYLLLQE
uniref:Putative olfactory receptor 4-like protein n=1 Tax=Ixodes ricinus TaxID=34613 RepID=A0A6B0VBJ4_IXORI